MQASRGLLRREFIQKNIVSVHTRNYRDQESAESRGSGVFRKSDYQVRRFELLRGGWPRMKRGIASRLAAHTLHHWTQSLPVTKTAREFAWEMSFGIKSSLKATDWWADQRHCTGPGSN